LSASWNIQKLLSLAYSVISVIIILFVPCSLLYGETIQHRFSSQKQDPKLENILYVAAGIEFVQNGLSSTRKESPTANYILSTQYSSTDGNAAVHYKFCSVSDPNKTLSELSFDVRIDSGFDTTVAISVRQVLKQAAIHFIPSPDATIDGILSLLPKTKLPDPTPIASPNAEIMTVEDNIPKTPELSPIVTPGSKDPSGQKQNGLSGQKHKFDLCFSTQGISLQGDITKFLHYGISGSLDAGFTWPDESWSFTLGGKLSIAILLNNAGVSGGPLFLSTVGPNIVFGTGEKLPYKISGNFSAGAAILTIAASNEVLSKIVPYTDIGGSISIPIGRNLYTGLELGFLAVFNSDVLILGTTTALMLKMEL